MIALDGLNYKFTLQIAQFNNGNEMLIVIKINKLGKYRYQPDVYNDEMEQLGYEAWGKYHISGSRFFVK